MVSGGIRVTNFASFLQHAVRRDRGGRCRISIASNFDFYRSLWQLRLRCGRIRGLQEGPVVGLGAPLWNNGARATITGITRGAGRKELARAALEPQAERDRRCRGGRDAVTFLKQAE